MSATLAGLRAVPVALMKGQLDLSSIDPNDARRALVLWANSPANPSGHLDDLERVAQWGRANDVLVASDECYCEYTWASSPRTVLEYGPEGVLAVHSISKRSNLAGIRAGFYTGDPEVVRYLRSVRQHAGSHGSRPRTGCGRSGLRRRRPRERSTRAVLVAVSRSRLARWSRWASPPPRPKARSICGVRKRAWMVGSSPRCWRSVRDSS